MPQLHSNFELNSKLSNFTRDSFERWVDMENVNPLYIDEGHISYCVELNKHFVFHTDENKRASWIELIPNTLVVDDVTSLNDTLAESLQPGSIVFVKNIDKLYYKGYTKYLENQGELSGSFHPILTADEIAGTFLSQADADKDYLKKDDATSTYLSQTDADKDYLKKDDATSTYLSQTDADKNYLTKLSAKQDYLSKENAELTYAKKEDIAGLIDKYEPSDKFLNTTIAVDVADGLKGQTGSQVRSEEYSWGQVFDKILFKEVIPQTTLPSLQIELLPKWSQNVDKINDVWIVDESKPAPDSSCFGYTNVEHAQILYDNGNEPYTREVIINSATHTNSKVFCKVFDDEGNWNYVEQDGDIYHIPTSLSVGSYRYYYEAYFRNHKPLKNNSGEIVSYWDEKTPILSSNYIEINVSKPVQYNTINGMVSNPILYWDKDMTDYFELDATCKVEQKFILPRPAKKIYMWNDLCGYAEDSSFMETVSDTNYIYSYPHTTEGHRGAIKIKVEF